MLANCQFERRNLKLLLQREQEAPEIGQKLCRLEGEAHCSGEKVVILGGHARAFGRRRE
jgi:hypothetical protein